MQFVFKVLKQKMHLFYQLCGENDLMETRNAKAFKSGIGSVEVLLQLFTYSAAQMCVI